MSERYGWWFALSGVFFFLQIILLIGMVVIAFYLMGAVRELTTRVTAVSVRVEEVLVNARDVSKSLGTRASSIAATVDKTTAGIAQKVEIGAAAVLAVAAVLALRKRMRG